MSDGQDSARMGGGVPPPAAFSQEPFPKPAPPTKRELRIKSRNSRKRRLQYVDQRGLFWQIGSNLKIPREPAGYDRTLQQFSTELAAYFSRDVDLFPARSREDIVPSLFDDVHRREIGEKFPSDEEARDLCELIRYVLINNFAKLTVYKFIFAVASALVPLFMGVVLHRFLPAFGAGNALTMSIASYAVALMIFAGANTVVFSIFRQRSEKSCSAIELGLQSVFSGIDAAYRDAIDRVQSDENRGAEIKGEWPRRADWWSRLIVWYPKRVEYLEKVFQIAAWRILFSFTIWKYGGLIVSLLTMTALLVAAISFGAVSGLAAIVAFVGYVVLVAFLSVALWSPGPQFINDNIGTTHWVRFSALRSDERVAELISHFINHIIGEQRPR